MVGSYCVLLTLDPETSQLFRPGARRSSARPAWTRASSGCWMRCPRCTPRVARCKWSKCWRASSNIMKPSHPMIVPMIPFVLWSVLIDLGSKLCSFLMIPYETYGIYYDTLLAQVFWVPLVRFGIPTSWLEQSQQLPVTLLAQQEIQAKLVTLKEEEERINQDRVMVDGHGRKTRAGTSTICK